METSKKPRKPLSEEALEKLKIAREKANIKRKELAEQRAIEKEKLVCERMEQVELSKKDKLDKEVEKEAKKRAVVTKKKPKDTVVVEYSSSDSEDTDFAEARVMFVKKDRPKRQTKDDKAPPPQPVTRVAVEPPPPPASPPKPKPRPDKLDIAYRRMFGI